MNIPQYGVAHTFEVSLASVASPTIFQANPTLAAGDVKVSKDGGSLSNITTLPSAIGSGKLVTVLLSATEMQAERVVVIFSDASGGEWCDLVVEVRPIKGLALQSAVNDASATTTAFVTDLTGLGTDAIKGRFLVFTSGSLIGQSQKISAYNTSTGAITVGTAFTAAPADNDEFVVVGGS